MKRAVRQDGTYQGRARGLIIYAKDDLKTVKLNLDILDSFDEGAGISVPWLGGKLSLVLTYRPPRHPDSIDDNGTLRDWLSLSEDQSSCVISVTFQMSGGNSPVLQQEYNNKFGMQYRINSGHRW